MFHGPPQTKVKREVSPSRDFSPCGQEQRLSPYGEKCLYNYRYVSLCHFILKPYCCCSSTEICCMYKTDISPHVCFSSVPTTGNHLDSVNPWHLPLPLYHLATPPTTQEHTPCRKESHLLSILGHRGYQQWLATLIREYRAQFIAKVHLLQCPAHLSVTQMPPIMQITGMMPV